MLHLKGTQSGVVSNWGSRTGLCQIHGLGDNTNRGWDFKNRIADILVSSSVMYFIES